MATRVYAWDANPNLDQPLYKLSNQRADAKERSGDGEFVTLLSGRRALQLLPPPEHRYDTRKCLIPFVRVLNKLKHPPKLHYPVPACGAHTRPLYVSDVNFIPEQ